MLNYQNMKNKATQGVQGRKGCKGHKARQHKENLIKLSKVFALEKRENILPHFNWKPHTKLAIAYDA